MIQLRKMAEEEFEAFKAYVIEEYAQEIARDYDIALETARKSATKQTNGRLSQGLDTPDNFIYCIVQQTRSGEACIGYLEYSIPPGENFAWLDNIDIFVPYQNQGHGKRALMLMEQELAEKGITSISLHVSARNERAQSFYQNRGFKFTGHQMKKEVCSSMSGHRPEGDR